MARYVSVDSQNDNDDVSGYGTGYGAGDDYASTPVKHAISSPNSWPILGAMVKAFSIIISLVIIVAVIGCLLYTSDAADE